MFKKLIDKIKGNTSIQAPQTQVVNKMQPELAYYQGTNVRKLVTKESPRQILSEDFPKHEWPISGGWGYTQQNAVVIDFDNEYDGVRLEYKFLEYRSYEEAIIFRPKGQQLAGFRFDRELQSLVNGQDGKSYDHITMKVTAFSEEDFSYLKNDWESHNAYMDDEEGKMKHLRLADSKKIQYEVSGWFDITKFYGKG